MQKKEKEGHFVDFFSHADFVQRIFCMACKSGYSVTIISGCGKFFPPISEVKKKQNPFKCHLCLCLNLEHTTTKHVRDEQFNIFIWQMATFFPSLLFGSMWNSKLCLYLNFLCQVERFWMQSDFVLILLAAVAFHDVVRYVLLSTFIFGK